jgi:glycosyltransferase involved in cell wall biosynthesis
MKILQIVHSLPFLNQAGTEIYAYNLCRELAKKHKVYVFSRACDIKRGEYEITREDREGVIIYLINNTFKYCDTFESYYDNKEINRRFAQVIDEIKPDIVHIHHLIFLSAGILKIIKNKKIPLVFYLHDYWLVCPKWHLLEKNIHPCEKGFSAEFDRECVSCNGEMLNIKKGPKQVYILSKRLLPESAVRWLKSLYFGFFPLFSKKNAGADKLKERSSIIKGMLEWVDIFLSPSDFLQDKFISFGIPKEKIRRVGCGFDKTAFIDTVKSNTAAMRFGFIGTLLPAKGAHVLIEAFNKLERDNCELRIYGRLHAYTGFEYYLPHLKKIAKNKNIRFMGEFQHSDITGIFNEIDVLVVPSIWYENSPLVIHEAFLSQTPVIASRIGGIPELVTDNVSGFLFEPGDVNDLVQRMRCLVDNRSISEKLIQGAPDIKDISENAKEVLEIYESLLARRASR